MIAHRRHLVVILAFALIAARRAGAQCDSCRVAILSIPAGARGLGLGGAYVAGDGPEILFYNAAQVGSVRGSALAVDRVGGATLGQFTTSGRTGRFGIGAGIRFLTRPQDGAAADSANLPGGSLVAGVALATQVRGIWVGAIANFVAPDLRGNGGGAAFDLGAAVRRFGLRLGLAAQNLGRDLKTPGGAATLPTRLTLGASLPGRSISTYFDVAASAALSLERGGVWVPSGGFELIYEPLSGWTVTGRAGARRPVNRPGELRQAAVSLGGSFGLNAISIDYAFQPAVAGGKPLHSIGLRIQ